ncbi:hypothetical protein BDN67DRAFT_644280 [Paxillus ammoniavirescens]|nr:hypothetical protein BDN67DRAFT_644280 [Paxillus ammoniavirescens]
MIGSCNEPQQQVHNVIMSAILVGCSLLPYSFVCRDNILLVVSYDLITILAGTIFDDGGLLP